MIRGALVILVLLAIALFALRDPGQETVTRAAAPARNLRIVSLAPSFTEILLYLGAEPSLVGVTVFCEGIDPSVPRVGTFLEPDVEKIVALHPDLVIAVASTGQESLFATLRSFGLTVEVYSAENIPDLRKTLLALAGRVGKTSRAAEFLRQLDSALQAPPPGEKSPRALFVIDHQPLYVAGGGSFVQEMLSAAGLRNVFADRPVPWLQVEMEEIIRRAPDIIIDVTLDPAARGGEGSVWAAYREYLPAVGAGRVYPFPQVRCGMQICDWIARLRRIAE